MKPYTYTVFTLIGPVTRTVNLPGSPAPQQAPQREYKSVKAQLVAEHWDIRDATAAQANSRRRGRRGHLDNGRHSL